MVKFLSFSLLALTSLLTVNAFDNQIYLIRHGEKPSDDDAVGLSSQGESTMETQDLEAEMNREQ